MTTCPYCQQPISTVVGRDDCPHCGEAVYNVSCPKCSRRTLNLTLIPRYGKAVCFACATEVATLPETQAAGHIPAAHTGAKHAAHQAATAVRPSMSLTPRAPKVPTMPSAAEARKIIEECLVGLERAAQDREMLHAVELRAIVTAYIESLQDLLALDDFMNLGKVTPDWLRGEAPLDSIIRLCYRSLWPEEGAVLPLMAQAWVLAVDDIARRWQYARRRWLAETCALAMMPIVPGITLVDPAKHNANGLGHIVTSVTAPGFLLGNQVLRKARVRSDG